MGGVGSSEGLTCITDSLTQWMGPTLRRLVQLVRFQREGLRVLRTGISPAS